jgi:surface protein
MKTRIVKLFVAIFLMVVSANLSADTLRVNHTSTATGPDGSTWALAYQDLQAALFFATTGDEIWIAKGTYHPTSGVDRDAHFDISEGLSIYGNFNGTENALADRDMTGVLDLNQTRTVLSGEIHDSTTTNDNSKVIVRFASQGGSGRISILDGITIEDARGHGFSCILDDDTPDRGVYINNVLFNNNDARASFPSFDYGGAIKILGQTGVTVNNSRFIANKANYGSAIYRQGQARINMSNCVFEYNIAQVHGTVHNVSLNIGSVMSIENCSFTNNTNQNTASNYPSCVSIWGIGSLINVSNSIFWGNGSNTTPLEIGGYADVNVRNSIVQGGFTGPTQTSVQDIDPNWISPELNLSRNSPAIDVGDNSLYNSTSLIDIDGDVRIQDGTIDLGAQEGKRIDPDAFVITVEASLVSGTANFEVTIPTNGGGYDYNVDWGDGSNTSNETGDATKSNYSTAGPHKIQITRDFPRIYYLKQTPTQRERLKEINQWGNIQWESLANSFYGCSKMQYLATDAPDLSNCTDLTETFRGCSEFNGNINNWDVSNITKMLNLFAYASEFNSPLSNWNTTNVVDMRGVFFAASKFNQDINTNSTNGTWDVSNVTQTYVMFAYASSFNKDLSNWNTSKVWNMKEMFRGATMFNQDIGGWDVSSVTDFSHMFRSASAFDSPLNNWNTSSAETMFNLFAYASSFDQPISNWNVSKVEDMRGMFFAASKFNQDINTPIPNPNNVWNVSNVTQMFAMFQKASLFNKDISNWNTSMVWNMLEMFRGATAFNQNIGTWNIASVSDMYNMLSNSGLDECNYDATLKGWVSQTNTPIGIDLGAINVKYGTTAHKVLLTGVNYGWIITDGGAGSCPIPVARKKAPSSISNVEDVNFEELTFYPNPTSNSFQLNGFDENVQVTLMDVRGKVVLQTSAFSNTSIDVSSLAKGVYILHAIDASKNQIYDNLIIQ